MKRAAIVVVGAMCLVAMLATYALRPKSKTIAFDSARWKESDDSLVRANMIDDLEANRSLVGKSESEIVDMLGKPGRTSPGSHLPHKYDALWEFPIGSDQSGYFGGSRYFAIRIHNGHAVSAFTYTK